MSAIQSPDRRSDQRRSTRTNQNAVRQAFTLIELLVVIAILAVLAGMLLPALAKTRTKDQSILCMNNQKQLTLAWRFYANENDGTFVGAANWNRDAKQVPGWMSNHWMDLALPASDGNWNAEKWIKPSKLYPYTRDNVEIFKCPADSSTGISAGKRVPRIRSMSMNTWVGGPGWAASGAGWKVYAQDGDMTRLGPAATWVFMDERADSINDGMLTVDMAGHRDQPAIWKIVDYPGSYHHRSGVLSFADGNSEIRKWRDRRTVPELRPSRLLPLDVPSPNNQDILWLQERSSSR